MSITRIYFDYPDYSWLPANREGIDCVDDTARAAVMYLRGLSQTEIGTSCDRKFLNFIRYMQADYGEF